jgi:hypothetical protein
MHDQQYVRAVLAAGLTWLYDTEQPEGAIETHHGAFAVADDRLSISFAPIGLPVVVIDIRDARYDDSRYDRPLLNPLTAAECDAVAGILTELGRPPIDRWNGAGCESGSFRLATPIHPTLEAACARYRADCPEHGTVFCGSKEGCTWLKDGRGLIVAPKWPVREDAAAAIERDAAEHAAQLGEIAEEYAAG